MSQDSEPGPAASCSDRWKNHGWMNKLKQCLMLIAMLQMDGWSMKKKALEINYNLTTGGMPSHLSRLQKRMF